MSWAERLSDSHPHIVAYAATAWGIVVVWQLVRTALEVIVW